MTPPRSDPQKDSASPGSSGTSPVPGRKRIRYHDLDALRAFAMLLGIVMHSTVFLIPVGREHWPVQDSWMLSVEPERNPYVYFYSCFHNFRMQLFFILSGFFTAMQWRSRGLGYVWRQRLGRVGLPLAVCMVTILPAVYWLFSGSFSPRHLLAFPVIWEGGWYHLWFLWFLLLMFPIFVLAVRLGLDFRHPAWWLLLPLCFVPEYFMEQVRFGPDNPSGASLVPKLAGFAYYLIFFTFGVFFYQRKFQVRRWWAFMLAAALLLVFPIAAAVTANVRETLRGILGPQVDYSESGRAIPDPLRAVYTAVQILYAWLMCFGMMGLFRWFASKERFWVRYVSDSSYWLYVAHFPLVVALQMLVVGWEISAHLKFALICFAVSASLLVVYANCVRYTAIGRALNGPRARRRTAAPRRGKDSHRNRFRA